MNPVVLELLTFAGRRAVGAVVSCAALMLFKASVDAVQRRRNRNRFFNPNTRQLLDPETGEYLYATIH